MLVNLPRRLEWKYNFTPLYSSNFETQLLSQGFVSVIWKPCPSFIPWSGSTLCTLILPLPAWSWPVARWLSSAVPGWSAPHRLRCGTVTPSSHAPHGPRTAGEAQGSPVTGTVLARASKESLLHSLPQIRGHRQQSFSEKGEEHNLSAESRFLHTSYGFVYNCKPRAKEMWIQNYLKALLSQVLSASCLFLVSGSSMIFKEHWGDSWVLPQIHSEDGKL